MPTWGSAVSSFIDDKLAIAHKKMIFRLTLKLSKKIGLAPLPAIPFDEIRNPLIDWSAHLFTAQRIQYIIMTNTVSLYSMVMYGRGITNDKQFIRGGLSYMREFMTIDGNKFIFEKYIEPQEKDIFFSKIVDRRVMGSMNDLIFQAKVNLVEARLPPFDVSFLLNETPMSYLGYGHPRDAFRELSIEEIESPSNRQRGNNVIYINMVRPPTTRS
jgi:hypothetical protein